MSSAILRKSVTDLTRRKARAFFTVLTLALALAVASVGLFAVPGLMQQSMDREIAANRLADVTLETKPLVLSPAQIQRLQRLPNVRGVSVKNLFSTRIYVGARRQKALIIGVPGFARQNVDVVATASGAAPGAGAVFSDTQNASEHKFAGDAVRVIAADGRVRSLPVTGKGRALMGGAMIANGYATFSRARAQRERDEPKGVATGSIKAALKGAGARLSPRHNVSSGDKAERAQRRAHAEAARLEHKRYTDLSGGGGAEQRSCRPWAVRSRSHYRDRVLQPSEVAKRLRPVQDRGASGVAHILDGDERVGTLV